ncbi:MAG: ATP-binding protein [Lachnospiraceae bacterium]
MIRPLLCLTREEIEDLLRKENLPFRTDATNLETDYARNRIRLNILPLLREELNPRACEHLAETAERLALAEDYLAGQARKQRKAGGPENGRRCGPFLDREGFLQEPEALKAYILRYCLREVSEKSVLRGESLQDQEGTFRQQEPGVSLYNISSSHLSAITELASRQSGRSLNLPGGLTVHTEGAYLIFDRPGIEKEEQQSETELIVPGTVRYGKYRLTASIFPYKNEIIPEKMYTKWFDYDTIKNTVQIRPQKER